MPDFLASADRFSIASASDGGAHLAYINRSDKKPYYMHFNRTCWDSAVQINSAAPLTDIDITNSLDNSLQMVVWEKDGTLQTAISSSGIWGSPTTVTTEPSSRFPMLPAEFVNTYVPLIWTSGFNAPFDMMSSGRPVP